MHGHSRIDGGGAGRGGGGVIYDELAEECVLISCTVVVVSGVWCGWASPGPILANNDLPALVLLTWKSR